MSVALGTDVKGAAMQLGKALNDPAKGLAKLQRSGVTFTDAQKEQVKALQASGKTLEAQKIILAEVNKEFGGSAEAAGKTLPGQIAIMRESFNNFAGMLVAKLIPILQTTIAWLREHWPEIAAVIKKAWEEDIRPTLVALGELIASVVTLIADNWATIGPIVKGVVGVFEAQLKIVLSIVRLFAALLRGDWRRRLGRAQRDRQGRAQPRRLRAQTLRRRRRPGRQSGRGDRRSHRRRRQGWANGDRQRGLGRDQQHRRGDRQPGRGNQGLGLEHRQLDSQRDQGRTWVHRQLGLGCDQQHRRRDRQPSRDDQRLGRVDRRLDQRRHRRRLRRHRHSTQSTPSKAR